MVRALASRRVEALTVVSHDWQKIEPSRLTLEHVATKFDRCSQMLAEMVHGGRICDFWGMPSEKVDVPCASV